MKSKWKETAVNGRTELYEIDDWNRIDIQKSQMKTIANILMEENKFIVGFREVTIECEWLDESDILWWMNLFYQRNIAETFVWCCFWWNIHRWYLKKKTSKFSHGITCSLNNQMDAHIYIHKILNIFLIPSIENRCDDKEVIFQDNNAFVIVWNHINEMHIFSPIQMHLYVVYIYIWGGLEKSKSSIYFSGKSYRCRKHNNSLG